MNATNMLGMRRANSLAKNGFGKRTGNKQGYFTPRSVAAREAKRMESARKYMKRTPRG